MVGLAFFFCGQTQRDSCMNPILLKKTLIRFLYGWSTATGGVLLSQLSLSDMLEFLNSDELKCVLLNKLWLPVNVYNRNNVPFVPDADTFADWLRTIQVFFPDNISEESANYEHQVCNHEFFPQCIYNNGTDVWKCENDTSYVSPLAFFYGCTIAVMCSLYAKEVAKLVALLATTLCNGGRPIPVAWRAFVRSSVLCPVLIVYSPEQFFLLVKHDADACDGLGRAIYQGLFGDFLTFPLGLYYALKVTSVGLTTWNLLCLLASGVGVVQLVAFLVIGVSTCSCRLCQPPQKQSVHIDINREDNQPGMLHQPLTGT